MKTPKLLLGLLLSFSLNILFAQTKFEWKTGTSGGYTYRYVTNDPMKARFYKLKNGLTVILSENHKEPRIQTLIPTRAGSNTDPRTNTGLAHYLEHMLFKGTDKFGSLDWAKEKPLLDKIDDLYEQYNKTTDSTKRKAIYKEIDRVSGEAANFAIANEYDKLMASMGAQGTNAFTSFEQTVYTEDIPSNAIDRFLTVQAERFRHPILRIFHTELEAVYEEKNRGLDNDGRKVFENYYNALFPTHNYGQQTTIGTVEHLKNPSLIEIRKFYDKYYVPNNMAIIFAGDFNSDVLIKKIDEKFAYMQPKPVEEYNPAPEKPLTAVQTREVFGPTPENVTIAYRLPGAVDEKNKVLATLTDEIMSNSAAGLIDLNLNKQQKILGGSSTVQAQKDYSVWVLSGRPKQGQTLDQVKDLLLSQVEILKKGQFDERLIKSIVNNYKLNQIQGLENNNSRAYPLLSSFIISKGENWLSNVSSLDAMSKITKKDIVDFANKYLLENYVVIYKRKGKDESIKKVEKPAITPVETNRDKQSEFLKTVNDMPMADIKPVWLDFKKDIKKGKVGKAEVLYVQNTDNELFRLGFRFKMGTYHNKLLSLAAQYLQFLGTDKYTAEQLSQEFYSVASSYNIQSSGEYTTLRLSGLQENFNKSLALVEHVLKNCKADEAALTALKERIIKSRADSKLNKGAIMQGLMNYAQYGAKNPFNNQLSNEELKAVKSEDLLKILHELLSYEHTVIYYGPQLLAAFEANLPKVHPIPASFIPFPEKIDFKQIAQEKNQVFFADYDMVQSEISWVRNTVPYNPAQTPTIDVFNNYFGGGMASIVFQTIRESKALAYSTYAYYNTPSKKGEKYSLVGYIGSQADKLNDAVAAMNELLNNIPDAEKTLEVAKKNMKKTYDTERITQDGIIYSFLSAQEHGIEYDERQKTYDAIDSIHFSDLKKFADENLANKPYTYCIVASEKQVKPDDLKKYGEFKKLTLEELFGY
ncbi:Predicted Zn-dependent peptidase [Pseudarcicella hirudinis]|uniref:Predicted Zn-dependent peptidase n=1 Tax=Pseudarcicella hirudinis TaxID=1079859 RepID=A0A1I5RNH8_9BACT|nr:M16 family metallopeptidase [Pseudarcicella hirudinis]SFP60102.1 Predicted Zn-dependent peptidase [Pseudarcicella hirudinis]